VEDFIEPDYSCLDIINDIISTGVMWLNLTAYYLNGAEEFFCCFSPKTCGVNTDLDPELLWDIIKNSIPLNTKHTLVFIKVFNV